MTDPMPHGDPLEPRRDLAPGAEPRPTELEARLDEIENQDVGSGQAGRGVGRPAPRQPEDLPQPDTGAAKLQGEDEGPTAEGGGQSLETAGGGGR